MSADNSNSIGDIEEIRQRADDRESDADPELSGDDGQPEMDSSGKTKTGRSKKSSIYKYFDFNDTRNRFYCKYCKLSYQKSRDGSTASLRKHISTKHEYLLNGGDTPRSVSTYLKTGNLPPNEKFSNEGLCNRLVHFVVMSDQPFKIVESIQLRESFSFSNPNSKLPSEQTIRRKIKKEFNQEFEVIKEVLQKVPGKISFILDCWTSKNQWPFLGIMAEWIDSDWQYNSVMIDLKILEGSHSGANIAASFWEVVQAYGLQNKIQSVTTDNTGNMDTFFSSFEEIAQQNNINFDKEKNRVRCLAHILNLCCQAAIERVNMECSPKVNECDDDEDFYGLDDLRQDKGMLSRLRKCVVKIRSSPQRREAFRRQCDAAQLDRLELVRDVSTRWNSTFDMIVRALKMRPAINSTIHADKELVKYAIDDQEWEAIEYLKCFLEPFKDITVFLSTEKFPTISYCAFIYSTVFKHLEKYEVNAERNLKGINEKTGQKFPESIRAAAMQANSKLLKYYPSADSMAYIAGTVLDPRCKVEMFSKTMKLKAEVVNGYKKEIRKVWTTNYLTQNEIQPSEQNPEDLSFFAQELAKMREPKTSSDELEMYLKSKTVSPDLVKFGTLGWWKDHENDYPGLARMARDYLAACGTGVPVERLFSLGPDLLTDKRLKMSPETIRECISLKCWIKFKNNNVLDDFVPAVISKMSGGEWGTSEELE